MHVSAPHGWASHGTLVDAARTRACIHLCEDICRFVMQASAPHMHAVMHAHTDACTHARTCMPVCEHRREHMMCVDAGAWPGEGMRFLGAPHASAPCLTITGIMPGPHVLECLVPTRHHWHRWHACNVIVPASRTTLHAFFQHLHADNCTPSAKMQACSKKHSFSCSHAGAGAGGGGVHGRRLTARSGDTVKHAAQP
eukprot:357272-Chlamydomonas_euryale.AAC.2